jgi:hypothetical protein
MLSNEQIKEMLDSGLVEIGSHTLDHVNLPKLNKDEKERQILKSQKQIEEIFNIKCSSFAYPFGFFDKNSIVSDTCMSIPLGNKFHFGVLMSTMHMAWVKTTCGRLKSDFRYSKDIVYNNYPWPENPTEKQVQLIEEKAQNVLDVRASFPNSSLADLYNPLTMPPALVKAHNELDKAVDAAYSKQNFSTEAKRMEFLFELYEKYTADLFVKEKPKKIKKTDI